MKVLLVGGGGREHAIAWKLKQSDHVKELLCAPGNAGIAKVARVYPDIRATDIEALCRLAADEKVDFVVVAPDDPLSMGLVDRLEVIGIPAFGPTASAAKIEASKTHAKELMERYNIPTAAYQAFTNAEEAVAYVREQGAPIVIKADGLALGKGVVIAQTVEEAEQAVRDMLESGRFGESGKTVVIEECMTGREVTQLVFTDGHSYALMPSSQDHKRAFDHDEGPNTGGMGAFAPSPYFTKELRRQTELTIIEPMLSAMRKEGTPFKGVLYVGLMLTPQGPRVVEFNARFGDPETQAVLPLLRTDIMDIFLACREGDLAGLPIYWSSQSCTTVVLASGGYPESYETGFPIEGLEHAEEGGAMVFHAGTKEGTGAVDGAVLTAGGRVLAVSALGDTLEDSTAQAYMAAECVQFANMHKRMDIGRELDNR